MVCSLGYPNREKLELYVVLVGTYFGCIGTICGAAVFAVIALIARMFNRDKSNSTNNGQAQSSPWANHAARDD
jgi:hypothetical protein